MSYPSKAKVGKSTPTRLLGSKDEINASRRAGAEAIRAKCSEEKQPEFTVCSRLERKMLPIPFLTIPECLAISQGKPCIDPVMQEDGKMVGRCVTRTLEIPE